jgi:hypothetical protein
MLEKFITLAAAALFLPLLAFSARAQIVAGRGAGTADLHVIKLTDQGAKCDGETDDSAAITAWLALAKPHVVLQAPAGVCIFRSALAVPAGGMNNVKIAGEGAYQTILEYAGLSTEIDLLTIGDGVQNYINWSLEGFSITSATTMTSGAGMHIKKLGRSHIREVVWDGQDGRGTLFDGVWFDSVDEIFVS